MTPRALFPPPRAARPLWIGAALAALPLIGWIWHTARKY
jgi:hypothetical protein